MMKYVGMMMIVASGGALGFLRGSVYRDYVSFLEGLAVAVDLLETEIRYKQCPLEQAFVEVGRATPNRLVASMFIVITQYCDDHVPDIDGAGWRAGIDAIKLLIPRGSLMTDYLMDFGLAIRKLDLHSQRNAFVTFRRQLGLCLDQAHTMAAKESRIWQAVGLFGGMIVAIILL